MTRKAVVEKLDRLIGQARYRATIAFDDALVDLFKDEAVSFIRKTFGQEEASTLGSLLQSAPGILPRSPQAAHRYAMRKALNFFVVLKGRVERGDWRPPTRQQPTPTREAGPLALFDSLGLHHQIASAARSLFESGHYAQAVLEAFKALNNMVKDKSGLDELDGRPLMARAFGGDCPVIRVSGLRGQSGKDEQEGFKFLFMGSMVGIRNPKAHEPIVQKDPSRTLEYLALASLLAKHLDESEVESPGTAPANE